MRLKQTQLNVLNLVKVMPIIMLGLIVLLSGCDGDSKKNENMKTSSSEEKTSVALDIKSLEEKAFSLVESSPEEAVEYFITLADKYGEAKDTIKYGLTLLNISNLFDEYLSDDINALAYAEKALGHWAMQEDTLQMANLYKYIGLINGRLKNFAKGKEQIQISRTMYEYLGSIPGLKVCDFNLASLLYYEGDYEGSIDLALSAEPFWLDRNDDVRRFNIHTLVLKNYRSLSEELKAKDHMLINENLIKRGNIPAHLIQEFRTVMAGKDKH